MAPLILVLCVLRSNVVTLLMCTPCFVQGLNNIFMVFLFMHITRKHIALVMCRTAGRILMDVFMNVEATPSLYFSSVYT